MGAAENTGPSSTCEKKFKWVGRDGQERIGELGYRGSSERLSSKRVTPLEDRMAPEVAVRVMD